MPALLESTHVKVTYLTLALGLAALPLAALPTTARAETIRIAIGTQDTTINCATGGLVIRELKLLQKYLPREGRYKDVTYDIQWKNFTTGAPITNEMLAGKLDIGVMADFPGSLNGASFEKVGKKSRFFTVLSGSPLGSGNGVVVPTASSITALSELKGKTISVPFASTAHGMLLRAIANQGWDPARDVNIITQAPEVAGPALQANRIEAHANFVPFAELFTHRGFARKIFDGSQAGSPTFHGALVTDEFAERHPEVVTAYLRAVLEADRLVAAEPEKFSELIEKHTGIEAPVNYLFHGPLGLQTRDLTWKPEYRQALATSIETLTLLGRIDVKLSAEAFIDDQFVRAAFQQEGLDYDARLANYDRSPLEANDAATGKPITDVERLASLWVTGESTVRHYANPESAFAALKQLEADGKTIRAVFVQDHAEKIKLLAPSSWFAIDGQGRISAFLDKDAATKHAGSQGGHLVDYEGALAAASKSL